jgi:peptidyl-prolyl cis-trans isomerase C
MTDRTTQVVDQASPAGAAPTTADRGSGARARVRRLVPRTRVARLVAIAVVALLLVGAGGAFAWWRLTALPADAALRVGDTVVTVDQLDARMQTLQALYGVTPPTDPAALDTFRRNAAKSVALSTVLDQQAAVQGIVIADKKARDALDRYVATQFGAGGHDAFVKALGVVGTSEAAVLAEVTRQLALAALMDKVIGTVTVSDADLHTAFDQRRDQLGQPEQRTLRHIVVGTAAQADAVLAQLRSGTPFEKVAAQQSQDASTRDSGGVLGTLSRAQLEPAFGDAAFAAAPGQPFGPVQTDKGFYVGRVDKVVAAKPAVFDQVEQQLRQTLQTEQALARWRGWLGDRLADADVQYADDYRPADPGLPADPTQPLPQGSPLPAAPR